MLKKTPEVASAIASNQPVVALESTIISHGMPYPQNVETALRVEETVRKAGATPATIAVLDGYLCAGLTIDQIEQLGKTGTSVRKCSRRDLPTVLAQKVPGATTVAATMIIAEKAGIPIFATGGIGGVHRGGANSLDISADLSELSQTSVAVVCAGAKSILDLPLTLEYLETMGVPVWGYQTDEFPAFFSRSSGLWVDDRFDSPKTIAKTLKTKWSIPLPGGVVIANPIPPQHELAFGHMQHIIERALEEAETLQVKGKGITPFLLSRIEQLTEGESLLANIELVLNNARLAAAIAVEMAVLR